MKLNANTWAKKGEIFPKTFNLCVILFLQAYYREGVALQALGKDAEALASLASGLAADPKSTQLLTAMVETAIRSPLKGTSHLDPKREFLFSTLNKNSEKF